MQEGKSRRGEGLARNEINAQEMGGQENMSIPLQREYFKDMREMLLHHFTGSSHTTSCRTVRKCLPALSHLFAREQAPGSECRKR